MKTSRVALLLVLALSALWRWGPTVRSSTVLPDEDIYVAAARQLEAGRSPYAEPGYFYPPPVAMFVHWIEPHLGEIGALRILRVLSLGGLTFAVWLALLTVEWPWYTRMPIGVVFICWAPTIDIACTLGNVAGLAAALVLSGLVFWHRHPAAAGIALGLGLAIKPIAPLAPLLLVFHRPAGTGRHHVIAATTSVIAAGGACLIGFRYLPDLLTNATGQSNQYNFSLRKVLSDFGFEVPALLLAVLIGVIALVLCRRRRLDQQSLLVVAVTASLMALPILWAHSLLILFPVQLLAVDRCVRESRHWRTASRRRYLEVVIAVLAVFSTLLAHAVGTTYGLPAWAATGARIVPLLSIAVLGWFVLSETRSEKAAC